MGIKLLYISSANREDYRTTLSSDFLLNSAEDIYGSYRLKAISIPNTIYTIDNSINDTFHLVYASGGTKYNIDVSTAYVTDGFTLASIIQNALNGAGTGATFTVSYDDLTSKLIISNPANQFQLDFSNNSLAPINSIMGFPYGIYSSTTVTPFTITSPTIVNLTRTPTLFITMRQANNYLQNVKTGVKYTFLIPNNVTSLYFIDSFFDQTVVFNKYVRQLNVTVRDEDNRIVNLQNVDWYMVLESLC